MTRRIGSSTAVQPQLFERINRVRGAEVRRLSLRLPRGVGQEVKVAMTRAGYSPRQKSQFVEETARQFLDRDMWEQKGLSRSAWMRMVVDLEMVRIAHNAHETFQLSPELYRLLWRASIHAALWGMRQDPPVYLELSIASVLRAALLWRVGLAEPAGSGDR